MNHNEPTYSKFHNSLRYMLFSLTFAIDFFRKISDDKGLILLFLH